MKLLLKYDITKGFKMELAVIIGIIGLLVAIVRAIIAYKDYRKRKIQV